MANKLIKKFDDYNESMLTDILMVYCMNIENAMIQMGAEPGKDYSYQDLMTWAIQTSTASELDKLELTM